jgi:hypothetical protein
MKDNSWIKAILCFLITIISVPVLSNPGHGESRVPQWKSQTIYVPIYSFIYLTDKRKVKLGMSVTLSIRNTDADKPITFHTVDYFDSKGGLVKKFISSPRTLPPMSSSYFSIEESDESGGWGANFILKWKSDDKITQPVIQAIHSGARGTHSYIFDTSGKVIEGVYE